MELKKHQMSLEENEGDRGSNVAITQTLDISADEH